VKAGAIYALGWDYVDMGNQCGVMAQKILQGTAVTALPTESPRKVSYALNRKAIEHMNIKLTSSVMNGAIEIYE
jgi:putative ABC transport system substrate-binding protein